MNWTKINLIYAKILKRFDVIVEHHYQEIKFNRVVKVTVRVKTITI